MDGQLSCWGANITDTYLKSKGGEQLFTVRSENWNERLGVVSADEVAVVVANDSGPLQPVTLRSVLQNLGQYGSYAGLNESSCLFTAELDVKCSIRFQPTFIPVEVRESEGPDGRGKLEFATEAYNYNTMDDADPRNLVLLCTRAWQCIRMAGARSSSTTPWRMASSTAGWRPRKANTKSALSRRRPARSGRMR